MEGSRGLTSACGRPRRRPPAPAAHAQTCKKRSETGPGDTHRHDQGGVGRVARPLVQHCVDGAPQLPERVGLAGPRDVAETPHVICGVVRRRFVRTFPLSMLGLLFYL